MNDVDLISRLLLATVVPIYERVKSDLVIDNIS